MCLNELGFRVKTIFMSLKEKDNLSHSPPVCSTSGIKRKNNRIYEVVTQNPQIFKRQACKINTSLVEKERAGQLVTDDFSIFLQADTQHQFQDCSEHVTWICLYKVYLEMV